MDRSSTVEQRIQVLKKFILKLKDSDYDHPTRTEILKSGFTRYYRKVSEHVTGISPLHRSADDLADSRRLKALHMTSWYDTGKRKRGSAQRHTTKSNPYHVRLTQDEIKAFNAEKRNRNRLEISPPPKRSAASNEKREDRATGPQQTQYAIEPSQSPTTEVITETVIYVPHTPRSRLKIALQKADNLFAMMHDRPQLRFAERAGTTIVQECSRSDPWIGQWRCGRAKCLPCRSRDFLKEEEEVAKSQGHKPEKEISLPGCTEESVCYTLQCIACRAEGKKRQYEEVP